ncbi:hypothetical protein KBTX_02963 [wastewater metagenome]|uniref:Uncharacterized protein n=2 Tax=unclassified sequences TaxID=12908 RepID=A0A5B8RF52_9ZZZZ|nr:hypothetical protein KBTEX_02963 [uncultured organism]
MVGDTPRGAIDKPAHGYAIHHDRPRLRLTRHRLRPGNVLPLRIQQGRAETDRALHGRHVPGRTGNRTPGPAVAIIVALAVAVIAAIVVPVIPLPVFVVVLAVVALAVMGLRLSLAPQRLPEQAPPVPVFGQIVPVAGLAIIIGEHRRQHVDTLALALSHVVEEIAAKGHLYRKGHEHDHAQRDAQNGEKQLRGDARSSHQFLPTLST